MFNSVIPWAAAYRASLSFTISWSLLKLMSIESVMPCNHVLLCRPFLLLSSFFPCNTVFSSGSAGKEPACSAGDSGDVGSIPESGRSPGEGNSNPLQYTCLENPHGQGSVVGYSPWGDHKESDRAEWLTLSLSWLCFLNYGFLFYSCNIRKWS